MLSSQNKQTHTAQLDRIFKALGDHTRREILNRLVEGPAPVGEIAEPFEMSLPAVGKHLRVLESAGLIVRQIDGRTHRCSLSPMALREADLWLAYYRPFWDQTLESLAAHFKAYSDKD